MSVVVTFTGAVATTNSVKVGLVENSAHYTLASSQGVAVNGTFTFNTLSVTQNAVLFGVAAGATFTGTITLDVTPNQPNGTPVILVSNLTVDSATVTYPTNDGPETQVLTPGQELTLSGFVIE
uniref:Uncharacterized protein n=1 Tax=Caulobacter sp. (strain K31) TaxID=366602 RepID=B0T4K3_CAUSK